MINGPYTSPRQRRYHLQVEMTMGNDQLRRLCARHGDTATDPTDTIGEPPQLNDRVSGSCGCSRGVEETDRVDEPPEIALAVSKYTATLTAMAELPSQAGVAGSPRRWNRLANELQRQHLALRESSFGQQAISALMDDPRAVVRVWAAGHGLFWDQAKARSVLEALRDDTSVGVLSVDAKYTLKEFDKGRLNPCWEPPARR